MDPFLQPAVRTARYALNSCKSFTSHRRHVVPTAQGYGQRMAWSAATRAAVYGIAAHGLRRLALRGPARRSVASSQQAAEVISSADAKLLEGLNFTDSKFCNGWSISQLEDGYRYCGDDILCAHLASREAPNAKKMLDLGSGIGTIGLAWLAQQPRPFEAKSCTMLEAQNVSVALCKRTLKACNLEEAVDLRQGDLRDKVTLDSLGGPFDVVTANPPYFTDTCGVLPKHPQRAHCRHELRGGILEFCHAAASQVASDGRFCIIHAAPRIPEVLEALPMCNFSILRRVDLLFRGNCKSVALVCRPEAGAVVSRSTDLLTEALNVQDHDGQWTPAWIDLCKGMGF
eukprot:TRINITY_DN17372_c0_g1_i1.p1 TRINITY_DN17372_c0_g1~~TRINITY_DN17372_c0_g1_i1.p1  ORF type:complete len:343 (-),score=63.80 TRINITY_DN17372_c0_g1_i1:210-1238(-)